MSEIKQWFVLDDERMRLEARIKEIAKEKEPFTPVVLAYMRDNKIDDLMPEGFVNGVSRTVRTVKPSINRNKVRTQLLIHFGDQPQKVSDALKDIEGIVEDADGVSSVGIQKEFLMRKKIKSVGTFPV